MFIPDASDVARSAMLDVDPSLVEQYASLAGFLTKQPDMATALRGKNVPEVGTADYIRRQAKTFADARTPRAPKKPDTIPDEMVSLILGEYFGLDKRRLEQIKDEHALSMAAENVIGDLLERYLASVLEPHGWVWCSGTMVKAIDFVKPPISTPGHWRLLQVKNRDNSENSSSSAIRDGTTIEKWHRTFAKKPGANWAAFPDDQLCQHLSEIAFAAFVRAYLKALPK